MVAAAAGSGPQLVAVVASRPWWVLVSEQALVTVQQQALWLLWWALVGHCGRPWLVAVVAGSRP